jgi:hypothetical protein
MTNSKSPGFTTEDFLGKEVVVDQLVSRRLIGTLVDINQSGITLTLIDGVHRFIPHGRLESMDWHAKPLPDPKPQKKKKAAKKKAKTKKKGGK